MTVDPGRARIQPQVVPRMTHMGEVCRHSLSRNAHKRARLTYTGARNSAPSQPCRRLCQRRRTRSGHDLPVALAQVYHASPRPGESHCTHYICHCRRGSTARSWTRFQGPPSACGASCTNTQPQAVAAGTPSGHQLVPTIPSVCVAPACVGPHANVQNQAGQGNRTAAQHVGAEHPTGSTAGRLLLWLPRL